MSQQGPFDNDNSQFVVSFELLYLFRWLFEHEQETLKKLLGRALKNGLYQDLMSHPATEPETQADLQQSVIDFFALLETLLYELLDETDIKKALNRHLIPTIDQIDSTLCDKDTVAQSVAKASSTYEANPAKNPKEILCKELLKRWKPSKKLLAH